MLQVPLCILLPNASRLCVGPHRQGGSVWSDPDGRCACRRVLMSATSLPSPGSFAHASAGGDLASGQRTCGDRLTGMRGRSLWVTGDDSLCDLNGTEPRGLHRTRGQSLSPSSPGANLLHFWDHACMNAYTHYKSYGLSIGISLTPTKIYNMSW